MVFKRGSRTAHNKEDGTAAVKSYFGGGGAAPHRPGGVAAQTLIPGGIWLTC